MDAHTKHQLQVERRERVIEPIKCMRSPHTSYRWRGERVIEPNQVDGMGNKGQWGEFGQDTLFTRSAIGFVMTTESQDLSLTSQPKMVLVDSIVSPSLYWGVRTHTDHRVSTPC